MLAATFGMSLWSVLVDTTVPGAPRTISHAGNDVGTVSGTPSIVTPAGFVLVT